MARVVVGRAIMTRANCFEFAEWMGEVIPAPKHSVKMAREKIMLATYLLLGFLNPSLAEQEAGRVRLEAEGREIVDVIHLIAQAAGEEVFIYPEVKGRVNVRIDDLSFEEALSLVLAAKGKEYTWRKIDGVYHVGRFEEPPASPPPAEEITETVSLHHRDAGLLARLFGYVDLEVMDRAEGAALYSLLPSGLKTPPQPILSRNALMLHGTRSAVTQMATLLRQIDRQRPQITIRFQAFAVTPEVVEGIKLRWRNHPGLRLEGALEPLFWATRNFDEVLAKLALTEQAHLLFSPLMVTENLALARLALGGSDLAETIATGSDAGACEPTSSVAPPVSLGQVPPGSLSLALVPRVEPGYVVRLWFRVRFGGEGGEEPLPGRTLTLWADGLAVPPGESLALYLPPPPSPLGPAVRPPLLMFITPQVVEEELG